MNAGGCERLGLDEIFAHFSAPQDQSTMTEQLQLTSSFHSMKSMHQQKQCMPSFDLPLQTLLQKSRVAPALAQREEECTCNGCGKTKPSTEAKSSFLRCSCCKAVNYCNAACQKLDWLRDGLATPGRSHRDSCREFREDKKEFAEHPNGKIVQKQLFSWDIDKSHSNGILLIKDLLESRGLTQENLGFWEFPDSLAQHQLEEDDRNGWCHGQMLLKEALPFIEDGFVVLKPHEIPSGSAAVSVIYSWSDYVTSRNLSRTSIAPLLLTNVLTVYHMIIHELKLHRRSPKNGKRHVVCVLGAASELNFLPLFEELAFLLPRGMDVELRFISPAVKHVMNKAFWGYPESHLMTCGDYVIDKTAPNGGRVRVALEREHGLFHKVKFRSIPDAAIALNAGLESSGDWSKTFVKLVARETPFCVSERTKYSLRFARSLVHDWIEDFNNTTGTRMKHPVVKVPKRMDIHLNPFHGIVEEKKGAIVVPNISNGYILSWHPPTMLPGPRG